MQFLQDEFVNIAQSDAFPLVPRKYLVEALKSDFLQVLLISLQNYQPFVKSHQNLENFRYIKYLYAWRYELSDVWCNLSVPLNSACAT